MSSSPGRFFPSPSLETISVLVTDVVQGHPVISSPDETGTLHPLRGASLLRRAIYISGGSDVEAAVSGSVSDLTRDPDTLLAFVESDSAGGTVVARIFLYDHRSERNQLAQAKKLVRRYYYAPTGRHYSWDSDGTAQRMGYFLTGHPRQSGLWSVVRFELDPFGTPLFTLRPIRLHGSFPFIQIASLQDDLMGKEINEQYREMQRSFSAHSYRATVSSARNIAEAVAGWVLRRQNLEAGRDLFGHLRIVQEQREHAGKELDWFSDLAYHVGHKIRILHGRVHIDSQLRTRTLTPSEAITAGEDMVTFMREFKLVT